MQNLEGFRLSPQQTNLWSLQQDSAGQPYRVVCALSIAGELQPEILERALYQIISRHEILRTTFHRPPGIKIPFQVVSESAQLLWRLRDLTNLDWEQQQIEIKNCFRAERDKPFDFERGPLVRATLAKLSNAAHALLITLPALYADAVTASNLVKELSYVYCSLRDNEEFAGEAMQYADFAEWQNELLESEDPQAAEGTAFWKRQEAAREAIVTLPLERRTRDSASFEPQSIPVAIERNTLEKIKAVAREQETPISSVLFACWQALVWRLTGRSDFVIFNLSAGRKIDDLKDALGPYAKYLPVLCHCEDVSIDVLSKATHRAINEAEENQEYFDPATTASAVNEAIAFEFEEQPATLAANSLTFSVIERYVCIQLFKLKLSCVRSGDAITADLQYDSRVFERETVERFVDHFARLLSGVNAGTIGAIDIVGDAERQQLLFDLNRTQIEYPKQRCIHELFEAQAARTPAATALVFGDQELTYDELNARANQLAHLLRRRGAAPNDRVGLCMARGAEMIVCLLGILKAGGAYVPLNLDHPRARVELQLAESSAKILITAGALGNALEFAGETIDLERDRDLLSAEPVANPTSISTPEDLVYVIYTSGSTGVPKGVAVRHRNLVNYTHSILRSLRIDAPLHFATVSTITADLGNTCIFPSLVSGGCLHILSYDVSMEGDLFRSYVEKRPIDVLKIVPSHLSALLAAQADGTILPRQYLILGGEALSWELIQRISEKKPLGRIINHYGPTETTVGSLTFSVESQDASNYSLTAPIGRPIANTRVYVIDAHLQPLPIGVAGELYIGGAGVAAGYLNQPAETAARFVADPFSEDSGARLYRTGDLARYLPDGNIEFLGRADTQVKVRGFRVELGEIEAVLTQHNEVRQAVVTVDLDSPGEGRIVAYVVSSAGSASKPDELRNFLRSRLPDYMIPSAFVFLKTLPLTPNGKVDRAALPAPDALRPEMQRNFVAPRNVVETELAGIWSSMLKLDAVGVHDNFFDLGGHSLLATQVVSRMRKAFQLEIPLRALFESPTVAELAGRIERYAEGERAELLAELEALSEAEAERLLELEKAGSGDRKSS
jgi:amino acid adenylation domain-containing protein